MNRLDYIFKAEWLAICTNSADNTFLQSLNLVKTVETGGNEQVVLLFNIWFKGEFTTVESMQKVLIKRVYISVHK